MPNLDIRIIQDELFDLTLPKDALATDSCDINSTENLGIYVKTDESLESSVKWDSAIVTDGSLKNITLTGFDNFLINDPSIYNDGNIDTSYEYQITSGDTFTFFPISGHSTNIKYEIATDIDGSLKLNGGFLQGFYKMYGYPLEFFPQRVSLGWTVDMIIKGPQFANSGNTLNSLYPNNSGFVFYMGTRAENKYDNIPDESTDEAVRMRDLGFGLSDANVDTESGKAYTQYSKEYLQDTSYDPSIFPGYKNVYNELAESSGSTVNLVLYTNGKELKTAEGINYKGYYHFVNGIPYGTSGGTANVIKIDDRYHNVSSIRLYEYFPEKTIIDNAFGIRIKDDGTIGYRKITVKNRDDIPLEQRIVYTRNLKKYYSQLNPDDIIIDEQYSCKPLYGYAANEIINVTVTFRRDFPINGQCNLSTNTYRNGTLKIYSNGIVIYKNDRFDEIIARELFELPELQQTVPFNISWGGGSLGLLESVTFGGKDPGDLGRIIQENFAGTFEGNLYEFKLYSRPLDFTEIRQNFKEKSIIYNMQHPI